MIKSFGNEETRLIYGLRRSRKLPSDIQQVALRKLRMINNATSLNDLRVRPANRLETLTGERAGQHSVRTNDQWWICFRWEDNDAYEVEVTDHH